MTNEKQPLAPAIKALLTEALPAHGKGHLLVMGDSNQDLDAAPVPGYRKHLSFLSEQWKMLAEEHDVRTFGIEYPAFMNVFLWAYADGTMLREFDGDPEKARNYLRAVFMNADGLHTQDADERMWEADAIIEAMDHGVRVVAFESALPLGNFYYHARHYEDKLESHFAIEASRQGMEPEEYRAYVRAHPEHITDSYVAADVESEVVNGRRFDMRRLHNCWMADEAAHWLELAAEAHRKDGTSVDYASRLHTIEKLGAMQRERGIGRDASGAVLLNAMLLPGHNALALSSFCRIDGVGVIPDVLGEIHGTLPDHAQVVMGALDGVGKVTKSVFASTAMGEDIAQYHKGNLDVRNGYKGKILNAPEIVMVDLGKQEVSTLPQLEARDRRAADLAGKATEGRGAARNWYDRKFAKDAYAAFANPLLVPEIKQGFNDVREQMHNPAAPSVNTHITAEYLRQLDHEDALRAREANAGNSAGFGLAS